MRLTLAQARAMQGGGFEPPKAEPAGLQPAPFGHSGTPARARHCNGAPAGVRATRAASAASSTSRIQAVPAPSNAMFSRTRSGADPSSGGTGSRAMTSRSFRAACRAAPSRRTRRDPEPGTTSRETLRLSTPSVRRLRTVGQQATLDARSNAGLRDLEQRHGASPSLSIRKLSPSDGDATPGDGAGRRVESA